MLPLLLLLVGIEAGVSFFGALIPQIQQDFGVSAATVALAITAYHGVRLLINVPAGRLIARSHLPRMLVAGGVILMAGAMIVALAPVFPMILGGRVLMGIGSAMFFLTSQFWISKAATPATKAQLFSYNQVAALTGSALGPAVGGAVAGLLSWRFSLGITAVIGLITALMAPRLRPPAATGPASVPDNEGPAAPLRIGAVLGPGVLMMAFHFYHGGVLSTLLPLLAAQRLGLGPAAIGGILMLGIVWRFGAALTGGRLAGWAGTRLVATGSVTLMAATMMGLHLAGTPLALMIVFSLMSWANVGGSLVTALVTDLVPEPHWGTALGLNRTLADAGAMIAPLMVGFAIDRHGFGAAITLATAFLLAASGVAAALTSPRRSHAYAR